MNVETLNPEPKLTPMMLQYKSIKKTLPPNTILFFRLGDFYEMFFEDALQASEILDITLTGREGGEAGRVPMCGIPYHAFQGYVRTLVDHNLKVAICEQVGDPKLSKGIVERKITRIISPATYLEDENKNKNPEFMAAVVIDGKEGGLAYLDLGTGEFFVREMNPEKLESELSLIAPREVILAKPLAERADLMDFIKTGLAASVTVYESWIFEEEEGARLLKETFRLASLRSLDFEGNPRLIGACGALLYYLRDHLHSSLEHLRFPSLIDASEFMVLDRQTLRSLELVSGMNTPAKQATLLGVLDQTLTLMGARILFQWVTHPLIRKNDIELRQESVREFTSDPAFLAGLRSLLKGVKDMERTLSRLNCGVANARDLVNLREFLDRVPDLQQILRAAKPRLLQQLLADIRPFEELKALIAQSIVDAPPLAVRDGGMIRDGWNKDLDELRAVSKSGKSWILDFEKREIERTGIKSLKVKYSQVFGYTLEVSKSNLNSVPPDYIRRQTLANAERFVVPELTGWDEKITGAEDKIKALEYQIFNETRESVLKELAALQLMAKAAGTLDALASLGITAYHKKWTAPEITENNDLVIEGGRHPVVEAMLPAGKFVENDTRLSGQDHQLVVLTGPNMAGKSTYIRQVAQIVLLAQIGSLVPALRAVIGIVDRIFTRIGATDDLSKGESTFMVEMLETAHILRSATSKSLLILDEVGRGTSTFDGVSIAWAICEFLASGPVRPRTLFATHYHELTQLEDHFQVIKNFRLLVKETREGIVFLRKVVPGGSDRSFGIHVAELAGIPSGVTVRAKDILKILESENSEATALIEKTIQPALKGKKSKASQPLPLFDMPQAPDPLAEAGRDIAEDLKALDLNRMTPLEAMSRISEWQKKVAERLREK